MTRMLLEFHALKTNTTGNENVAIGRAALASNTERWRISNTADGYSSLLSNTTGASNTVIGED